LSGVLRAWLWLTVVSASLMCVSTASAGKDPSLLRAEAFVDNRCPADSRNISTRMWVREFGFNALYGNCRAGDGRDQHVWFFEHGRFVGNDAPNSSHYIVGLWRDDTTIGFLYVLYRQSDPEAAPTGGGAIVRFRWDGHRVQRLDLLPPRAYEPGGRAGR